MRGIRSAEIIHLSIPAASHVLRPLPSFTDVQDEVSYPVDEGTRIVLSGSC